MVYLQNKESNPYLDDFEAVIRNPVFQTFCTEIKDRYNRREKPEYSAYRKPIKMPENLMGSDG